MGSGLAPGETATCPGVVRYEEPGTYRAWALVDAGDAVPETEEANNREALELVVAPRLAGAYDSDGDVDGSDLAVFAPLYAAGGAEADLDEDGKVGRLDVVVIAGNFGR